MPIKKFIQHASREGLKEYFDNSKTIWNIDWNVDQDLLTSILEKNDSKQLQQLYVDAERICHMADNIGEQALFSATQHKDKYNESLTAIDRCIWFFINESEIFNQAESIRYLDQRRYGRDWSGYNGQPNLQLASDKSSLNIFEKEICNLYEMVNKVKVEVFRRIMTDDDGNEETIFQLTRIRTSIKYFCVIN